jgi:hypothetical protein
MPFTTGTAQRMSRPVALAVARPQSLYALDPDSLDRFLSNSSDRPQGKHILLAGDHRSIAKQHHF